MALIPIVRRLGGLVRHGVLNRAPAAVFTQLPGIGPTLARRIVEERTVGGRFRSASELARVRGISKRMVTGFGDRIVCDEARPPDD